MRKVSAFIKESAETIKRLKAGDEAKRYAKNQGFTRVGKDTMDGKTRYRYSSAKSVDKGDNSYTGHLEYERDHQTQNRDNVRTTYTKSKTVHNGIERSTIDRKKHSSVKDAVDHLNSLKNYHRKS